MSRTTQLSLYFRPQRRYNTALYWAEKVVTLGDNDAKDVYWLAQCMFLLREYHRAAHIIRSRGLEHTNLSCLHLAADSLFAAKDCAQAIQLLNTVDSECTAQLSASLTTTTLDATTDGTEQGCVDDGTVSGSRADLLASIWLLKGRVLDAMDNRALAMDAYVQALQHSVYCTEALDALVQHEMLVAWEENELLRNLPFAQQCSEAEAKVVQLLYRSKLKKYYDDNCPVSNFDFAM